MQSGANLSPTPVAVTQSCYFPQSMNVKLHVNIHMFILCLSPQECQLHGRSLLSSLSSALRIVPGTSQMLNKDSLI